MIEWLAHLSFPFLLATIFLAMYLAVMVILLVFLLVRRGGRDASRVG